MNKKASIVTALGERRLLLPTLLNESLAANDRAKYRLTLLQSAKARADFPDTPFSELRTERLACGLVDTGYDDIVAGAVKAGSDSYCIPRVEELCRALGDDLQTMIAACETARKPAAELFRQRLLRLGLQTCCAGDGTISGSAILALASAEPAEADSLHLLIMDIHKELNRLQAEIATDNVDGALTYGLRGVDRPLVAAFMKGVNRTRALKFEHPGLGTTATRIGLQLILQNDIGTTDAHILVVHLEGHNVLVTYSDNHLQRLIFFQGMFSDWQVTWSGVQSRTDQSIGDGVYHLCTGTYTAHDKADLKAFLTHLGSRLVFLIDWNRARKRLQMLAPKQEVLSLLGWAAAHEVGHMAFLKAGGERMIYDALQFLAGGTLGFGVTLDQLLGREAAGSFLRFILKACTNGLLKKRALGLIRDEVRVELYSYYHNAQQYLIDLVSDHAALSVEIATSIRDCLLTLSSPGASDNFERIGQRSREWEHRADELVISARELARQSEQADAIRQLLEAADDITDKLEEAAFHLTLLTSGTLAEEIRVPLATLARLLVEGSQEYLKAIENARGIQRSGSPDDMHDFLEAIHRIVAIERLSDTEEREVRKALVFRASDFRQAFVVNECARKLESAADSLMHTGMILRDHILGKLMGPV